MADASDSTFLATVITVTATIFGTILTTFVALRLGNKKEKNDIQGTINSGFKILVDELQEERNKLSEVVKKQGEELDNCRGENRNLRAIIDGMLRFMKANEIDFPADAYVAGENIRALFPPGKANG